MKASNTEIVETFTDEKNLTGACSVGASKNLSVLSKKLRDWTVSMSRSETKFAHMIFPLEIGIIFSYIKASPVGYDFTIL